MTNPTQPGQDARVAAGTGATTRAGSIRDVTTKAHDTPPESVND